MADLERIPVVWSGTSGLPGVSVFYGELAGSANADLKAFFTAIASVFPAPLTWSVPGNGDLIDETTGLLSGTWINSGGGGVVAASSTGVHAAGVGAYVNWNTGALVGTRRLRGRTFLCPLQIERYDASGTILAATLTTLQNAANTVVTAGNLRVWRRPVPGPGLGVAPVSATVPDQVTSLRSRRR